MGDNCYSVFSWKEKWVLLYSLLQADMQASCLAFRYTDFSQVVQGKLFRNSRCKDALRADIIR
jgi:hypothetical protein